MSSSSVSLFPRVPPLPSSVPVSTTDIPDFQGQVAGIVSGKTLGLIIAFAILHGLTLLALGLIIFYRIKLAARVLDIESARSKFLIYDDEVKKVCLKAIRDLQRGMKAIKERQATQKDQLWLTARYVKDYIVDKLPVPSKIMVELKGAGDVTVEHTRTVEVEKFIETSMENVPAERATAVPLNTGDGKVNKYPIIRGPFYG